MAYKLVNVNRKLIKVPTVVKGTAKVPLSAAGKNYLAARAGHPPNPPYAYGGGSSAQPQVSNVSSLFRSGGAGAGRSAGGGGTKVATTWQDQLQALYTKLLGNMETPAAQAARIQKGINAQIAAEGAQNRATLNDTLAANREITRAQQAQLAQQQARAMGFSGAIGSLTAQEGANTFDDYQRAAQNIQGLGAGLSGAVLDSQQAAANRVAQGIDQASGGINNAASSFKPSPSKSSTENANKPPAVRAIATALNRGARSPT